MQRPHISLNPLRKGWTEFISQLSTHCSPCCHHRDAHLHTHRDGHLCHPHLNNIHFYSALCLSNDHSETLGNKRFLSTKTKLILVCFAKLSFIMIKQPSLNCRTKLLGTLTQQDVLSCEQLTVLNTGKNTVSGPEKHDKQ